MTRRDALDFWELPSSVRREMCLGLKLLTQEEVYLYPNENKRYEMVFDRAYKKGKLGLLCEYIRKERVYQTGVRGARKPDYSEFEDSNGRI